MNAPSWWRAFLAMQHSFSGASLRPLSRCSIPSSSCDLTVPPHIPVQIIHCSDHHSSTDFPGSWTVKKLTEAVITDLKMFANLCRKEKKNTNLRCQKNWCSYQRISDIMMLFSDSPSSSHQCSSKPIPISAYRLKYHSDQLSTYSSQVER